MFASVICACRNEQVDIGGLLGSLAKQTHSNFEAIFVDDSTDSTRDIIREYGDYRFSVIEGSGTGCCDARNIGIDLARGDFIVFVTGDTVLPANHLERMCNFFECKLAEVVICDAKSLNDQSEVVKFYNLQHFCDRSVRDLTSQGYAVDTKLAKAVGGIPSFHWVGINSCRDWMLAERMMRHGARHVVDNSSVVGHVSPSSLRDFFNDRRLRGRMSSIDKLTRQSVSVRLLFLLIVLKFFALIFVRLLKQPFLAYRLYTCELNKKYRVSYLSLFLFKTLQLLAFFWGECEVLLTKSISH